MHGFKESRSKRAMTETVNEARFEEYLADEALHRTAGAKVCPGAGNHFSA